MSLFALDLIALMLVLLLSPPLLTAGAFARRGDSKAMRRLRISLPFASVSGSLLLAWAVVLKINQPSGMLISCSLAMGLVAALISLLLHLLDQS